MTRVEGVSTGRFEVRWQLYVAIRQYVLLYHDSYLIGYHPVEVGMHLFSGEEVS